MQVKKEHRPAPSNERNCSCSCAVMHVTSYRSPSWEPLLAALIAFLLALLMLAVGNAQIAAAATPPATLPQPLSATVQPEDGADVYAAERDYWKSLWYQPARAPTVAEVRGR